MLHQQNQEHHGHQVVFDAMILGKLFEQIFKEDIKIILTSNIKISELYKY